MNVPPRLTNNTYFKRGSLRTGDIAVALEKKTLRLLMGLATVCLTQGYGTRSERISLN